jgi:membrane-associated phospholipid phosphatase
VTLEVQPTSVLLISAGAARLPKVVGWLLVTILVPGCLESIIAVHSSAEVLPPILAHTLGVVDPLGNSFIDDHTFMWYAR